MEELWTKYGKPRVGYGYGKKQNLISRALKNMAGNIIRSSDVEGFKVLLSCATGLRKKGMLIDCINAENPELAKMLLDTGYDVDVYEILPDIRSKHGLEFLAWNTKCDLLENSDGCLDLLFQKGGYELDWSVKPLVEYGVAMDKRIMAGGKYFLDFLTKGPLYYDDHMCDDQSAAAAIVFQRLLKIQPRILMSVEKWEEIRPHLPPDIQESQDKVQNWERRRGLILGTGRFNYRI